MPGNRSTQGIIIVLVAAIVLVAIVIIVGALNPPYGFGTVLQATDQPNPPTSEPPTSLPPTNAPPTVPPATLPQSTAIPPTDMPPTVSPPTNPPPTLPQSTAVPPTDMPSTVPPPTSQPPTVPPATLPPQTSVPPSATPTNTPLPTQPLPTNTPTDTPTSTGTPVGTLPIVSDTSGAPSNYVLNVNFLCQTNVMFFYVDLANVPDGVTPGLVTIYYGLINRPRGGELQVGLHNAGSGHWQGETLPMSPNGSDYIWQAFVYVNGEYVQTRVLSGRYSCSVTPSVTPSATPTPSSTPTPPTLSVTVTSCSRTSYIFFTVDTATFTVTNIGKSPMIGLGLWQLTSISGTTTGPFQLAAGGTTTIQGSSFGYGNFTLTAGGGGASPVTASNSC